MAFHSTKLKVHHQPFRLLKRCIVWRGFRRCQTQRGWYCENDQIAFQQPTNFQRPKAKTFVLNHYQHLLPFTNLNNDIVRTSFIHSFPSRKFSDSLLKINQTRNSLLTCVCDDIIHSFSLPMAKHSLLVNPFRKHLHLGWKLNFDFGVNQLSHLCHRWMNLKCLKHAAFPRDIQNEFL